MSHTNTFKTFNKQPQRPKFNTLSLPQALPTLADNLMYTYCKKHKLTLNTLKFGRIHNEYLRLLQGELFSKAQEAREYLSAFPTDSDLANYPNWQFTKTESRVSHLSSFEPEILPAENFVSAIAITIFNDNGKISHVIEMLDIPVAPYMALDFVKDLAPNPQVLTHSKKSQL